MAITKTVWQIKGPSGADGADGDAGTNGINAYSTTQASFVMPAEGASVTISVDDNSWMAVGQTVYITSAGHFTVASAPSSPTTQASITNVKNTATGAYASNVTPGTTINASKRVSPAGIQGTSGTAGSDYTDDDELAAIAGLTSAADKVAYFTGSGTAALADLTAYGRTLIANATAADTRADLDLEPGTDVQAYHANLAAIAGLTLAANKYILATGAGAASVADISANAQTFLAAANYTAMRTALTAAASGANSDITSLAGLTTPLTVAQGGTGVAAMPYIHVNRGGTDQSGIATGTPTKVAFNTEVADSNTDFDTSTSRFTPTAAGAYAFSAAVQVNSLAAAGDIVKVHLYKNGTLAATGQTVAEGTENVQAQVSAVLTANGSTDYFEVFVEHDAGVNKDVEGDEEVTYWSAHWVG